MIPIPIRTDYRMRTTPWVNYALIGANVVVYVLSVLAVAPPQMMKSVGGIIATLWTGLDVKGGLSVVSWFLLNPQTPELHQFFSAMFLHADILHLGGNMLFLWVFGNAVNDRFGHLGYLLFYLAGGVLAGIGYMLLGGSAPVLGASGAIAAVTGAYLVLLPRARVTILLFAIIIIPLEISSIYFLLFQFVWNVWMSMSISQRFASGGVAYAAHSSGYAFGILVAAGLMAIHALQRDPYDLLNLIRTWRRRYRYHQAVSQGYDPFGNVSPDMRRSPSQWISTRSVSTSVPSSNEAREFELRRDINEMIARGDVADAADKYLQLVQIADDAVLPRQEQLDVANQLMSAEKYPAAADAYERFLRHYASNYDHVPDIHLMLGLVYGRYLHQYDRAREYLEKAVEKLTDDRKLELARGDLQTLRQRHA